MTKERKNRIHLIYGIILSISAVAAGICFIVSAYSIYQTGLAAGTQPYTVQTISAAFSRIAIPVYICLVLVLGGLVLNVILPPEKKKAAPEKNQLLILQRLRARTDLSGCGESLRASIEKQQKLRRIHSFASGLLLGLSSVVFLAYACDGSRWAPVDQAAKINSCMVNAVFVLLICLSIPFAYTVFTAYFIRGSYAKEIELMRQASALSPAQGEKQPAKASKDTAVILTRYAILAVALGLIVYGACNEGTLDVLAKAAAICTECVGLG